jgi:mannose-1-phosphate guanylyltransferase/phosphomannomutase
MTKIVIVAGGLATRMLPITEDIPKCMIEINGKPLIQHQLEFFKERGYKDFIFCVAHLAEKVKEYFKDGTNFGLHIQYVQETQELMGTAGSVKLAEDMIDEDFIVFYGDVLTSMNLDKLLQFHREKNGIATICLRQLPVNYKSSSIICIGENSEINVFLESPSWADIEKHKSKGLHINDGIYVFKKEIFDFIPKGKKFDFAKDLFPLFVGKKNEIFGYISEEFFRELGRVEKYEAFLQEIRGRKVIFE